MVFLQKRLYDAINQDVLLGKESGRKKR